MQQDRRSEWVFFVAQGRCQVVRVIRQNDKAAGTAFNLWVVDEGTCWFVQEVLLQGNTAKDLQKKM